MNYFWIYIVLALVFMGVVIYVAPRLMNYLDNRQTGKSKRELIEHARQAGINSKKDT